MSYSNMCASWDIDHYCTTNWSTKTNYNLTNMPRRQVTKKHTTNPTPCPNKTVTNLNCAHLGSKIFWWVWTCWIPERSKAHPKIHKQSLLKSLPIYKMRLSVNVSKGRISKSSQSVLRNQVEDIYKIEEKSPQQQFEGNKTISAVITIWESV